MYIRIAILLIIICFFGFILSEKLEERKQENTFTEQFIKKEFKKGMTKQQFICIFGNPELIDDDFDDGREVWYYRTYSTDVIDKVGKNVFAGYNVTFINNRSEYWLPSYSYRAY